MELSKWMDISEEVRDSVKGNCPVVALESTIISHGMPFPQNLETVLEVENIIREAGSIPATIAVIEGRIKIGLSILELEQFAQRIKTVKCPINEGGAIAPSAKIKATVIAIPTKLRQIFVGFFELMLLVFFSTA